MFDRDEGMEKMTIGGEWVWYIYHPRHPQNGQVRQTPEPPRWGAEVSRRGGSALARTDKNSARLAFCGWDCLRCRWIFEHLVPPSTPLVSPLIVQLDLKLNFKI
jgi:hypothetical protein